MIPGGRRRSTNRDQKRRFLIAVRSAHTSVLLRFVRLRKQRHGILGKRKITEQKEKERTKESLLSNDARFVTFGKSWFTVAAGFFVVRFARDN